MKRKDVFRAIAQEDYTEAILIRLTPTEKNELATLAQIRGLTMSDIVRLAIHNAIDTDREYDEG